MSDMLPGFIKNRKTAENRIGSSPKNGENESSRKPCEKSENFKNLLKDSKSFHLATISCKNTV